MRMRTPSTHEHDSAPEGLLAHAIVDPFELESEAADSRRRRRRQRAAAVAVAFVVLAGAWVLVAQVAFTAGQASTGSAPKVALTSQADGVVVTRPGRGSERIAAAHPVIGGGEQDTGASARYALDAAGSIVVAERMSSSGSVSLDKRTSRARAVVEHVDLFSGRVVIDQAALLATASSRSGRATGSLELAPSTRVLVDGKAVAASANRQIAVEGIGTISINEQAVLAASPKGDAQTGPRHRVVGAIAHVRITKAYEGLPAGTEIVIGRVDAGVREGKVKRVAHPAAGANPAPAVSSPAGVAPVAPTLRAGSPAPGTTSLPRHSTSVRGSRPSSFMNLQGYVFPVLGRHSYTDTWGAARASTGVPHQGTDIFADEGTPIVAPADGTLDRVGWNTIGGYRFWLFDRFGNSFYFAHLSAYSPIAVDGASVRAGDVIGFVGHTGDAQGTPNHLHFEVHPGNEAATNPFPFLNAWQEGTTVAIGLLGGTQQERQAPLSLLSFTDISANSGLGASVLDTVPDTRARPVEQENAPVPTDGALKDAIDGPGISARK